MHKPSTENTHYDLSFIDLFCGLGGFRIAAEQVCHERDLNARCVFSSDIDPEVRKVYHHNFGDLPSGDITKIAASCIPEHNILFAGFPCQPFSICGELRGFEDTRGTLFFDVARIIKQCEPSAFVLENVKQLRGHDNGRTLKIIIDALQQLDYHVYYKVLNALDFGVPQKRERIFIVGFRKGTDFSWPTPVTKRRSLDEILEAGVSDFYRASENIRKSRYARLHDRMPSQTTIWHENKAGNISAYPFSCAMRAGASYNYLLVNGERRLTEREMLRLQGFPEWFQFNVGYGAARRLAGNSVAVPCVAAVLRSVFDALNLDDELRFERGTYRKQAALVI